MFLLEASPGRVLVSRGLDHTRGSPSRFWRRDQITPHRTTDKFPQSSEHRVKQMGSCNSIIHIIPEKPLTRPQITTLMLFSPVNESPSQSPALQRTTTQISPWLTPLPTPSPPEEDPLSQEILTQAIKFGE